MRCRTALSGVCLVAAACGGPSAEEPAGDRSVATTTVPDGNEAARPATGSTVVAPPPTAPAPSTTPATTPATTPSTTPIPAVEIAVVGAEEVVFDYSEANCDGSARPDLPVRALRTDEQLSLTLPHTTNHRLVGSSFDDLTLSCEPIHRSAYDHDPAVHAHHEWLASLYTVDGVTVHGVVHNEFHGYAAELADSRRAQLDGEDPGDWQYLARSGGSRVPMTAGESGFTAGGLCLVDFWGAHPDVGCDAVSRWTSDRDGQLVVEVEATKTGVGGDGVLVDVRIDGTVVWEASLTDDAPTTTVELTPDVVVGSTIDVGVAAAGTATFDATELRTVITPDGVRCTADTWSCTRVELTAVRSDDGGNTFVPTSEPRQLVASPPGRYVHDQGLSAMWQPGNIVAHPDGSHVMIVQFDDARTNVQHSCLLRTENLSDPSAWRAWDGEGFSLPPVDPYTTDDVAPACARVAAAPISGLTWHPELELFVAVGGFGQFGRNGQYAIVSPDLFTWSDPIFIQPAEFVFTSDTPPFEPYATLIDHSSTAPSFDTIGDRPHLYFTRINDPVSLDFDLVRVPLEITTAG